MRRLEWLLITLLLFSSIFATKSLWHPGLFTSHDGPHQVVRLYYYQKALQDSQFPPRYILESLHGFGYPLFVFSYHLPWLISAPFRFLGLSIYDALKIIFFLTFTLSGLTMYSWQKKLWGAWGAFVGAFLYLWAPYRFVDVFVRGAAGEACAYLFLPLIFWGLTSFTPEVETSRIKEDFKEREMGKSLMNTLLFSPRGWIIGSLGIAGVILSHALIFLLVLPAILLYWLVNILKGRTLGIPRSDLKQKIFSDLTMFGLGFGLSAFYFLPTVFLKKYTVFEKVMAGTTNKFADHFPTLAQLIYSPWGYGFSFPGVKLDQMSFQVGIAQWGVVGISLILALFMILKGRTLRFARSDLKQKQLWLALTFLLIFFFSILMMLSISKPLWQFVNRFAYIDYPWRYLFLGVFTVSFLGGFITWVTKNNKVLVVVLLTLALYANRNHLRVNAWLDWSPEAFVGDGDTSNTFDEYTPLWANSDYIKQKRELVEILQGEGDWQVLSKKTSEVVFKTTNKKKSLYRANLLYFPEVKILVDGQQADYDYKDKGVLDFWLPEGEHKVKISFVRTTLERVAVWISLTSLTIAFFLLLRDVSIGLKNKV